MIFIFQKLKRHFQFFVTDIFFYFSPGVEFGPADWHFLPGREDHQLLQPPAAYVTRDVTRHQHLYIPPSHTRDVIAPGLGSLIDVISTQESDCILGDADPGRWSRLCGDSRLENRRFPLRNQTPHCVHSLRSKSSLLLYETDHFSTQ